MPPPPFNTEAKHRTGGREVLGRQRQLVDDRLEADGRDVAKLFFVADLEK